MSEDRRKFLRFNIALSVEFKPLEAAGSYVSGMVKDFSREGLSFISQYLNDAPKGTLELRVQHPRKDSFVPILGDVVWNKRNGDEDIAGIKFKVINAESKGEILNNAYDIWVEELSKKT